MPGGSHGAIDQAAVIEAFKSRQKKGAQSNGKPGPNMTLICTMKNGKRTEMKWKKTEPKPAEELPLPTMRIPRFDVSLCNGPLPSWKSNDLRRREKPFVVQETKEKPIMYKRCRPDGPSPWNVVRQNIKKDQPKVLNALQQIRAYQKARHALPEHLHYMYDQNSDDESSSESEPEEVKQEETHDFDVLMPPEVERRIKINQLKAARHVKEGKIPEIPPELARIKICLRDEKKVWGDYTPNKEEPKELPANVKLDKKKKGRGKLFGGKKNGK